jgi:hypothetical protein
MQQKITKLSLKNNPDGRGILSHIASDLSTKITEKSSRQGRHSIHSAILIFTICIIVVCIYYILSSFY